MLSKELGEWPLVEIVGGDGVVDDRNPKCFYFEDCEEHGDKKKTLHPRSPWKERLFARVPRGRSYGVYSLPSMFSRFSRGQVGHQH